MQTIPLPQGNRTNGIHFFGFSLCRCQFVINDFSQGSRSGPFLSLGPIQMEKTSGGGLGSWSWGWAKSGAEQNRAIKILKHQYPSIVGFQLRHWPLCAFIYDNHLSPAPRNKANFTRLRFSIILPLSLPLPLSWERPRSCCRTEQKPLYCTMTLWSPAGDFLNVFFHFLPCIDFPSCSVRSFFAVCMTADTCQSDKFEWIKMNNRPVRDY